MLIKKTFLKIFQNSQDNTFVVVSFFNKVANLNFIKKETTAQVFSVNFSIFKSPSFCRTLTVVAFAIFSYIEEEKTLTLKSGVWSLEECVIYTAQKMKFSITDFFSNCDQIRRKLRIWSHLLKKSLMESFIFCEKSRYHHGYPNRFLISLDGGTF